LDACNDSLSGSKRAGYRDVVGMVASGTLDRGYAARPDILDISEADWNRIHRINAKGVFAFKL
jgi:hypothetical protein